MLMRRVMAPPGVKLFNPQTGKEEEGMEQTRVLYFHDSNAKEPRAFAEFQSIVTALPQLVATFGYRSVVVDSLTYMELSARMQDKYVTNLGSRDPRRHWAASTDALEEVLMISLSGLRCNVGVVAHESMDKDESLGYIVRNPAAPGRLQTRLASAFGEFYHAYVQRDDAGKAFYLMQTRTSASFAAGSSVEVPEQITNTFNAGLYVTPNPIHMLVYGEPQSGKSSFMASLPKPLLVLFFDHLGKDTPYVSGGADKGLIQTTPVKELDRMMDEVRRTNLAVGALKQADPASGTVI